MQTQSGLENLSLEGMGFASSVLFEPNQIVRIECTELRALARVAHAGKASSGAYPYRAGVEFLTLRLAEGGTAFSASKK